MLELVGHAGVGVTRCEEPQALLTCDEGARRRLGVNACPGTFQIVVLPSDYGSIFHRATVDVNLKQIEVGCLPLGP